MKYLSVLLFEWKHFVRNPFKVIAWVLFVIAAVYGLHNGASLFNKQQKEIEAIYKKVKEQHEKNLDYYQQGVKGPPDRPWVDNTTPFWAIWNLPTYHIKQPETTMVYSIGQAEQFGFYKQISVWASPYDADMAEEIANPERLQVGTLDFSFVILYLTPILLLLFVYNIKSTESEQGFLNLISTMGRKHTGMVDSTHRILHVNHFTNTHTPYSIWRHTNKRYHFCTRKSFSNLCCLFIVQFRLGYSIHHYHSIWHNPYK
ncbi:MAG: hypothetical protein O9340_11740 [Cyclobacteriaceae bacterium]|jgi:ABC-2 type transport system permease protein|nr:hypothetical protein [Cyclobacteriaceae bacterium]